MEQKLFTVFAMLLLFGGTVAVEYLDHSLTISEIRGKLAENPGRDIFVLSNSGGYIDVLARSEQASIGFYRWKYKLDKTSFYYGSDLVDIVDWRITNTTSGKRLVYFKAEEPVLVADDKQASIVFSYDYFVDSRKKNKAGTLEKKVSVFPVSNVEKASWKPTDENSRFRLCWSHQTDVEGFSYDLDERYLDGRFVNEKLLEINWADSKENVSYASQYKNGRAEVCYAPQRGEQFIDPEFGAGDSWIKEGGCVYWNQTSVGDIRACPHTLTASGWMEVTATSHLGTSKNLDFSSIVPKLLNVSSPQLWKNVSHPDTVSNCTTSTEQVLNNGTPQTINKTTCSPYVVPNYFFDWDNIQGGFSKQNLNDSWNFSKKVSFAAYEQKKFRVWVDVPRMSGENKIIFCLGKLCNDPWTDSPPTVSNETFDDGAFINGTWGNLNISRGWLILNMTGTNGTVFTRNASDDGVARQCRNSTQNSGSIGSVTDYVCSNVYDGVFPSFSPSAVWAGTDGDVLPYWVVMDFAKPYWIYNFSFHSGGGANYPPANYSWQCSETATTLSSMAASPGGSDSSANWAYATFNVTDNDGSAASQQRTTLGQIRCKSLRFHILNQDGTAKGSWIDEVEGQAATFNSSGQTLSILLNSTVVVSEVNVTCINTSGNSNEVGFNVTVMDKDYANEQTVTCGVAENGTGFRNDITDITGLIYRINMSTSSSGLTPELDYLTFRMKVTVPAVVVLPSVNVSIINRTSSNASVILASEHVWTNANYSHASNLPESNSTFKWYTNNTNQSWGGGNRTAEMVAMIYKGVVGYWHLDGNFADSSGFGNTGTNSGNKVINATGVIGGAANFNATSWIAAGTKDFYNFTGNFSYALWFKHGKIFADGRYYISKMFTTAARAGGWSAYYNPANDLLYARIADADSTAVVSSTTSGFDDDAWHYLTVTINRQGNQDLYVDGNLKSSDSLSTITGSLANAWNLAIGALRDGAIGQFNGSIDEVGIWNRTLTANEVKQLYLRSQYDVSPEVLLAHMDNASNNLVNATIMGSHLPPATLVGGVNCTAEVAGIYGQACKFDGVNDYINVSRNTASILNFGKGDYSVEFWLNWTGSSAVPNAIMGKRETGNWWRAYITDVGVLTIEQENNNADLEVPIEANKQYHVAIVRNVAAGTSYLYINGVQNDTATATGLDVSNNADFIIGQFATTFFNGTIDEVRLSRKALTAQEINLTYSKGRAFFQNEYLLNSSNYAKGDALVLEYKPVDNASSNGTMKNSSVLMVQNSLPLGNISYPPSGSTVSLNMLNATNLSDFDGDSISCNWFINGTFNVTGCNATYAATANRNYVANLSLSDGEAVFNQSVTFDFDNRSGTSIQLFLDNKTGDRFYELHTTASLIANWSGQTGNETVCYDVLMSGFGVSFRCANTTTTVLFNISFLAEDTFGNRTSNGTFVNFTASGEANASLDNRTTIQAIFFNVTGAPDADGYYPENVTFAKVANRTEVILAGVLIGKNLQNFFFRDGASYVNITNLSFSAASTKQIFANQSVNGIGLSRIQQQLNDGNLTINLSFNISGFSVDAGNAMDRTENFNTSEAAQANTLINLSLSRNSTGNNASWENFEKNLSTFGRWVNAQSSACTLYEYVRTSTEGGHTRLLCEQGGASLINYWTQEFDVRNVTRINISVDSDASCSCPDGSGLSGSGATQMFFSDGASIENYHTVASTGCSANENRQSTAKKTVVLTKRPTTNVWDVIASPGGTTTFTPTLTGSGWYLGFSAAASGNSCSYSSNLYIKDILLGGIMANRTGENGSKFHNFSSVTTKPILFDNSVMAATLEAVDLTKRRQGALINVTYELSNDNGTSFTEVSLGTRRTFSTTGVGLVARINCTSNTDNQSCLITNLRLRVAPSQITNVSVDFGSDNVYDFAFEGILNSTNSPRTVTNSTNPIVDYAIANCEGRPTCGVPVTFVTGSGGVLQIDNFNLTTPIRNVSLNVTPFLNRNPVNFSVGILRGNLRLDDLKIYYLGSRNVSLRATFAGNGNFLSNNSNYFTTLVRYSIFNVTLPRLIKWTEFIFTNQSITSGNITQANVTPYGQNKTKSIHTIEVSHYESNANLSMRMNETPPSCLAFRAGNVSTSVGTMPINATWVENIFSNVAARSRNGSVWLWADATNCATDGYTANISTYVPKFEYARICSNCTRTMDLFHGGMIISTE